MNDRLPENRELLDAYRRAEPEALERVYRAYVHDMALFLRKGFVFSNTDSIFRFGGCHVPEDLQDTLQETFLFALGESARKGYNGLTPYKNYLQGIAKNVVLGKFRKNLHRSGFFVPAKRKTVELPNGIEDVGFDCLVTFEPLFPAPDEEIEKREIRQLVERVVQELNPLPKKIFQLHFLEDQSQEKIAAVLGINRNQIRKHIETIKKKLLKRIKKAGLV